MGRLGAADGIPPEFVALVERHQDALNEGRIADAAETSAEIMAAALEEAVSNPTPEILRGLLVEQAENDGQWEVARRMYEEDLAEAANDDNLTSRAITCFRKLINLARLECWQGKHQRAYAFAEQAVAHARTADWPFILAWALEPYAGHALRAGFPVKAVEAVDEGLSLLDDERATDHTRAQLLLCKAEALGELGQSEQVRVILDQVWLLLEPLAVMREASGIQSAIAKWWRLKGRLQASESDAQAAWDAWQRSADLCRHVAEQWGGTSRKFNAALAEVLTEFADAATNAGDHARAALLREECRAIPYSRVNR